MRFPKNPIEGQESRFADEEGKNPFSDGSTADVPSEAPADPFSPPADDSPRSDVSIQYEYASAHRGGLILFLSLVAVVVSGLCWLVVLLGELSPGFSYVSFIPFLVGSLDRSFGFSFFSLVGALALVPALVAILFGLRDLRGMNSGAIDDGGYATTTAGLYVAILASIASLGSLVWLFRPAFS